LLSRSFWKLLLPFIFLSASLAEAQTTGNGVIRGQITNSSSQSSLEGAKVHVQETNKDFLAGEHGYYEITSLPAGDYTLSFSYPGLDTQTKKVTVTDGAPVQQDMVLSTEAFILMDSFTVVTEREGNAAAIAGQRKAINSQTILSTDAFGNVAKGNLGNFLKRVPGIAGMSAGDGVDTDSISIRGNSSDTVAIDVDGTRVASADAGSRSVNVAALMTDMIERVEVVKTSTPDMDADSFGGRINLVTKSAFDTKGRRIAFRVADSYSMTYGKDLGYRRSDSLAPAFAAGYSEAFSVFGGKHNLGVIVSGNWERVLDIRGTTAWNFTDGGSGSPGYSEFTNASIAMMGQVRGGATIKLDYKASPTLTTGIATKVTRFEETMLRTRSAYSNPSTVNEALSTDPLFTVVDGARYNPEQQDRESKTNSMSWKFYAIYKPERSTQLNFDVSYDRAIKKQTDDFVSIQSQRRINYVNDRTVAWKNRPDRRFADIRVIRFLYGTSASTTTSLPDTYENVNPFDDNLSLASEDSLYFNREKNQNEVASYKVDFKKKVAWRVPIEFKTGARYQTNITSRDREGLTGSLKGLGSSSDFSGYLANDWRFGGGIGHYPVGREPDIALIRKLINPVYTKGNDDRYLNWTYDPTYMSVSRTDRTDGYDDAYRNDRKIWENTIAAYVQTTIQLGKVQVLGGVRMEHTDVDRRVPVKLPVASTTPDDQMYLSYLPTRHDNTNYDRQLPSLHLKYDITRNLVAKTSYTTNISRPNFGNLLSSQSWDGNAHTGTIPNLYLKPKTSRTYDVSLEYYTGAVGSFTLSVFREEIKNYNTDIHTTVTSSEAEALGAPISDLERLGTPAALRPQWEITTKDDSGYGWRHGLEIGYFQSYTFLPGAFRGLGAFANLTVLRTEGSFQSTNPNLPVDARVNSKLTNSAPRTANAGISYAYGRFDLRLQWNYLDAFLESLSTSNPTYRNKWRGERWQADFNGKYKLTRRVTLSLDLINFTSNHGTKYRGTIDPVRQEETNALGFLATGGVQVAF